MSSVIVKLRDLPPRYLINVLFYFSIYMLKKPYSLTFRKHGRYLKQSQKIQMSESSCKSSLQTEVFPRFWPFCFAFKYAFRERDVPKFSKTVIKSSGNRIFSKKNKRALCRNAEFQIVDFRLGPSLCTFGAHLVQLIAVFNST